MAIYKVLYLDDDRQKVLSGVVRADDGERRAKRYALTGRRVHDARHAATALEAGVQGVFTYDVEDWRVFEPEGIVLAGPPSVLAAS
jgi:predicted nucleic acid-binding protein